MDTTMDEIIQRLEQVEQRLDDLERRTADGGRYEGLDGSVFTLRDVFRLTMAVASLSIGLRHAIAERPGIGLSDSDKADLNRRFDEMDAVLMQIVKHRHDPR